MANPLMGILGNLGGSNGNLMMQAFGAMMRGESPKDFMRNLANTNPAFRGLDLTDINATAQKVCRDHGVDAEKLTAEIKQSISAIK